MSERAGPICIGELDVAGGGPAAALPARTADGRPYRAAIVLVRVHDEPIGLVELALEGDGLDGERLDQRVADALGAAIDEHLRRDGPAPRPRCRSERERFLAGAPLLSVIVATRDGEATLSGCLDSLLAADHPRLEVIVVDSASRGAAVRALVLARAAAGRPVAYLREDRPGLAVAHNRGLEQARGAIVAFTDDDVVVDRLWATQLARAFATAPQAGCVTGMILPLELDAPAQVWSAGAWGVGKGFERRVFDGHRPPGQPLYPYAAGVFGSGANMAFRADVLRAIGGFDPRLGAGTPARGGDDLAAFFDVIAAGHRLVYEPTAIVRHRHRADYASLRRQAYGYGSGLVAYLAKTLADDPRRLLAVAARAPWALTHLLSPRSPKNAGRPPDLPGELARIERRGMAAGAVAYARSRRGAR